MPQRRGGGDQYGRLPERPRPYLHWPTYRSLRRVVQLSPDAQDYFGRESVWLVAELLEHLNGLVDTIRDPQAPKTARRRALLKLQYTVQRLRPRGKPKAIAVEDVAFSWRLIERMYDQFLALAELGHGRRLGDDAARETVERIRAAARGDKEARAEAQRVAPLLLAPPEIPLSRESFRRLLDRLARLRRIRRGRLAFAAEALAIKCGTRPSTAKKAIHEMKKLGRRDHVKHARQSPIGHTTARVLRRGPGLRRGPHADRSSHHAGTLKRVRIYLTNYSGMPQ